MGAVNVIHQGSIHIRRGAVVLPMPDLAGAKAAAASGDTVIVGPGSYTVTASLAKDGVNWHFEAGATVSITDAYLFDCSTSALAFAVTGAGAFSATQTSGTAGVLTCNNASASVTMRAKSLAVTVAGSDTGSACVAALNGRVVVDVDDTITTTGNDYCVWWRNGDCYVRAGRIISTGAAFPPVSGVYAGSGSVSGKLWVSADEIVGTSASVGAIVSGDVSAPDDMAVWIVAKEIRSAGGSTIAAVDHRGGKLYVSAQKVDAPSGIPVKQAGSGSTLWFDVLKVEAGAASALTAGSSWQRIGQWLDNGATPTTLCTVSGGTHALTVQSMERTGAGNGFTVSAGTLNLSESHVAVTSGFDLVRSGGTLNATGGRGSGTNGAFTTSGTVVTPGQTPTHTHAESDVTNLVTDLAGKQPLDATLTALAGVTTAANKVIYATGSDAFTTTDLSSFGRTLIDDANAATARTTLGLATVASSGSASDLSVGTIGGVLEVAASALITTTFSGSSLEWGYRVRDNIGRDVAKITADGGTAEVKMGATDGTYFPVIYAKGSGVAAFDASGTSPSLATLAVGGAMILKAPNGTGYRISVSNAGAIVVTAA